MSDITSRVRQPTRVPPAETPGLTGLLTLAVAVVVVAGLYFGRDVLIPITLAILLSFLLVPLVDLLRRLRFGRVPSVLFAVVVSLGVITAFAALIGIQIAELAQEVPRYQYTIEHKVETLRSVTLGRLSGIMRGLDQQMQQASSPPATNTQTSSTAATAAPKPVPVEVHEPGPTPIVLLQRVLTPVISPLSTMAIVFIFAIFILLQREDLRDRLIRLFGSGDLHRTTTAMNDAARRLSKYFLAQLGINAAFGAIIATGLYFIGIPSPVLWGIIGMLLRFVPYIGAPLSAVMPLLLGAAVDPGWSMLIWTGALYAVVECIMGQVVEPLLYGHSTGLSPFSVVVAATFWTWLWGPIGLILSTPLTLCLVVLGRHVERLEFLDVMLGDRPALTPVESFYQRMLAGDPDEAQDQAETLLKERSLSSYYDEVALKGLQLAANDALRGALTPPQIEHIKEALESLVLELDDHDDVDPQPAQADDGPAPLTRAELELPKQPAPEGSAPPVGSLPAEWRSAAPIMCVAGRGPLDETATIMLAQLLRKHGLVATVVPHEAASRTKLGVLDVSGIAMVCVAHLEVEGSPTHLRYLVRRLRQRLPSAEVVVGIWPQDAPVITDERLRAAVGADYYTRSLRETVDVCLDAARKVQVPATATANAA